MLDEPIIRSIVNSFAEETKQRVIDNLTRRGLVAQFPLISDVDFEVKFSGDSLAIDFLFERKRTIVTPSKEGGKNFLKSTKLAIGTPLSVYDHLAKKTKPFLGKDRGKANLGFLRRANVYELIKKDYANELVDKILEVLPELAGKIVINGI
jgi:hypothetical protein